MNKKYAANCGVLDPHGEIKQQLNTMKKYIIVTLFLILTHIAIADVFYLNMDPHRTAYVTVRTRYVYHEYEAGFLPSFPIPTGRLVFGDDGGGWFSTHEVAPNEVLHIPDGISAVTGVPNTNLGGNRYGEFAGHVVSYCNDYYDMNDPVFDMNDEQPPPVYRPPVYDDIVHGWMRAVSSSGDAVVMAGIDNYKTMTINLGETVSIVSRVWHHHCPLMFHQLRDGFDVNWTDESLFAVEAGPVPPGEIFTLTYEFTPQAPGTYSIVADTGASPTCDHHYSFYMAELVVTVMP
jgi:hypothetical protein